MSIHLNILSEEQRGRFILNVQMHPLPFSGKLGEIHSPKTLKQIRYMHSLCAALSSYKTANFDSTKRDCKVEFGTINICTSIVTGDRAVRLKSFSDYTRDESVGFCTAMEVYLDENSIPYTASTG